MNQQQHREIRWLLAEKYSGTYVPEARQDITRLAEGEPVDYVIGSVPFLGCDIDLSLRPFIPRPETEYWVERAIGELKRDARSAMRCLDIFAGSGCIGVAVLKYVPAARVDFAEKDRRFLRQIRINADLNYRSPASVVEAGLPRYRIIQSDIFSNVRGRYDYIFANPPYVGTGERVQQSVLDYEPHGAVFASEDGLGLIRPFLEEAKHHLAPGGTLYMEFGAGQKAVIKQLLRAEDFVHYQFHKDQYKRNRFVQLTL